MPDPNVEIYADDTTLARSASIDKLPVLTRMINRDLICLERWCNENGMVINMSKTKSMLITGKRIRNNASTISTSIDAKLNDAEIEQVLSFKLLGVSLDQDLFIYHPNR